MKDVPKLGGPDSLFYRAGLGPPPPGYPGRLLLPGATPGSTFAPPSVTSPHAPKVRYIIFSCSARPGRLSALSNGRVLLQKSGKWNAMHVRIAWEIYNHQQKAKTEAKTPGSQSSSLGPSVKPAGPVSFDLLGKGPGPPGADFMGKRPGPPADLLRAHNPSTMFGNSIGLPGHPPDPFDPLGRSPFSSTPRFFGPTPMGKFAQFPFVESNNTFPAYPPSSLGH